MGVTTLQRRTDLEVAGVILLPPLFLWTEEETMKFFIDTANPGEIKKAYETGVMGGVTTNPTLISKKNKDFESLDAATIPYKVLVKHPLTDIGIERFLEDWKKPRRNEKGPLQKEPPSIIWPASAP